MALPTGSGTETIHAHHFEDVDAAQNLIVGVQYHTYTTLNVSAFCNALDAASDFLLINIIGYDSHSGASAQSMTVAQGNIIVGQTFVYNERIIFFGCEPSGTASLTAAHQLLVAAQGTTTAQILQFTMTSADGGGQDYDVHCSYLDQDWS
jgi:hypothetical protein